MKGFGRGKIILFGEHGVVYGFPAISAALDRGVTVNVSLNPKKSGRWLNIEDESNYISPDKNGDFLQKAFYTLISKVNRLPADFLFKIKSQLPVGAGIGSSAALSVAISEALLRLSGIEPSLQQISQLALEAEKVFHGRPSGIDTTVAAFGGVIKFKKGLNPVPIKTGRDFYLIITHVAPGGNTKEMVEKVSFLKEKEPKKINDIFDSINNLVIEGENALLNGDADQLGKLFNKNHAALKQLEVSTSELDEACQFAISMGATGAKLTGAGGGGCIISVASNEKTQNEIARNLVKRYLKVIKTVIK